MTSVIGPLSIFAGWLAASTTAWLLWRRFALARRSARRLAEGESAPAPAAVTSDPHWLGRWLLRAGFRKPSASRTFIAASSVCFFLAAAAVWFCVRSGIVAIMASSLQMMPGGLGDIFLPAAYLLPWMLFLVISTGPALLVRQARRRLVQQVDQDLPLTLDLLATMSEAGLSFDAGLNRVLQTRLGERPLASAFRQFQSDLMAGRNRAAALRRFAWRLDVPAASIFVSALVQAEQMGISTAAILRRQADDLRNRRRERAHAFANTLPVKRMFPLVVCFMPGLFVWTLGPVFAQLFQLAESLIGGR